MSPSKPRKSQWNAWIERDDRSWLKALSERKWSTQECHKSLGSMLESIVTSLHFSSHSRWGVQPSAERLQSLMMEFLEWMRESKEWTHLEMSWENSTGPWSLPLSLTRAYLRFVGTRKPEKSARSHSAVRALSELPEPHHVHSEVSAITESILDAFNSMSHQLPQPLRLSYQLHLEGLLNDEIAALLHLGAPEVAAHIAEAKGLINPSHKRSSSS